MGYSVTQMLLLSEIVLLHKTFIRKQTAVLCVSFFCVLRYYISLCNFAALIVNTHCLSITQGKSLSGTQYHTARASNTKANRSKISQEHLHVLWTQTPSLGKKTVRKKLTNHRG